jgi:hypothetical protein
MFFTAASLKLIKSGEENAIYSHQRIWRFLGLEESYWSNRIFLVASHQD